MYQGCDECAVYERAGWLGVQSALENEINFIDQSFEIYFNLDVSHMAIDCFVLRLPFPFAHPLSLSSLSVSRSEPKRSGWINVRIISYHIPMLNVQWNSIVFLFISFFISVSPLVSVFVRKCIPCIVRCSCVYGGEENCCEYCANMWTSFSDCNFTIDSGKCCTSSEYDDFHHTYTLHSKENEKYVIFDWLNFHNLLGKISNLFMECTRFDRNRMKMHPSSLSSLLSNFRHVFLLIYWKWRSFSPV